MLQKKNRRKIVKLLNSDCSTFQNNMLQMIFFASQQKRKDIFNEIQANAFLHSKFMNSVYRSHFGHLDRIRYCYNPELSDRESLEVTCDLIRVFKSKVVAYTTLRKKYEFYFFSGAYDEAVEILNQIDTEVCASLWSCGQRFLIRQQSEGFEGNKRELSTLSSQIPHNLLAQAVLFFYSSMAETDISYENYQTEASKFLSGTESTLLSRYLSNKINFETMLQYNDIALVVQIDCQCSIIDAYNSVEKYLPVCYADEIRAGLLDPRLCALGIDSSDLFNNLTMINAAQHEPQFSKNLDSGEVYCIIENYTMGNYSEVCKLAEAYLPLHPTDLQVSVLFCKALILSNSPLPDTIHLEYVKHIYSIYSMDESFRDAVLLLKQEAKRNHGLTLGHKLFSFLVRKYLIVGKEAIVFTSSILDSVVHPNFARYLKGPLLYRFGQHMHTVCPCSIALAITSQTGQFDSLDLQHVDQVRKTLATARYLCKCKKFDAAYDTIADLSKNLLEHNTYLRERIIKILLTIYAETENHKFALKLLVEAYFTNEFLFERINSSGIYLVPKKIRDKTIQKELYYTIYLYLVDRADTKRQLIGYNNYLDRNGFSNIIEALSTLDSDKDTEISKFFFENVCTIGLLKRDVTLHMLSISPETARIHILLKLISIAPSKRFSSEIKDLLTTETIKENLNTINKSRINVDTDKIFMSHREQWEESYRKYLTLGNFEELTIDLDLSERKINDFESLNMSQLSSKRTSQEMIAFNNIAKQIKDECLFSVQYGLETYLSSRIRHGYCKGQLTSFLSELHLLSMRKSEQSTEYFLNDYWNSKILSDSTLYENINEILAGFTRAIEAKISEVLKHWLRIKHSDNENGMFNYDAFLPLCSIAFCSARIQDFTLFYNRFIDFFWEFTETILKKVRARISSELVDFYVETISSMEKRLEEINDPIYAATELLTNCKIAKAKVTLAMSQFAEAFSVNNTPYNDFTMSDLTISCRRAIEKVHNESVKATWVTETDELLEFRGKYFAPFVDILCILLNNAIEHSGYSKIEQLEIYIGIQKIDAPEVDTLRELKGFSEAKLIYEVKVKNSLFTATPRDELERKLDVLFTEIREGIDSREVIQGEGGSGLYKLCNTAQYNIEACYCVTYEVEDDCITFSYCFVADDLICKEEIDENSNN